MGERRPSITFSAYLTGGVPDGAPLWREPPTEPTAPPAAARADGASTGADRSSGTPGRDRAADPLKDE